MAPTTRFLAPWASPTLVAFLALLPATPARAGSFDLVSAAGVESGTAEGGSLSLGVLRSSALSSDGRWVAFESPQRNLVPGQAPQLPYMNLFLRDRLTGTTVLVSHNLASPTTVGFGFSLNPSISADGRWVAYQSNARILSASQATAPDPTQVYLYDRETGTNVLVSHGAADPTTPPPSSAATNAVISADGEWISFDRQTGSSYDVLLYERATGQITLVSRAHGTSNTPANGPSFGASSSADGRYVAFISLASDLISGLTGVGNNVYLFDRVAGTMTLVNHASGSVTTGSGLSYKPVVSADGSTVVYVSAGTNLVAGQTDSNGTDDAFLFNRATGTNVLVSRSASSATTTANGRVPNNVPLAVSADGSRVAFASQSTNAVTGQTDNNFAYDIFLFERATASLTLVSHSAASDISAGSRESLRPRISAGGRFVLYESAATDLVSGQSDTNQGNDIFLFDRTTGTNALLSGSGGSGQIAGNEPSSFPGLSADGSGVAFYSSASDLVPGTADLNSEADVILHDRTTGASTVATLHASGMASAAAGDFSMLGSASADGRYAVFLSWGENLVAGQVDSLLTADVFLRDRQTGATTLVSHAAGSPTTAANGVSEAAAISADGAYVVFLSRATNLVAGQIDTNQDSLNLPGRDVFLYDRAAGTTVLVSHAAGSPITVGNQPCYDTYFLTTPAISADGAWITFTCGASNLVAGQSGTAPENVYLYERATGQTALVSHAAGSATTTGNGSSEQAASSADGRWITFTSFANNLVAGSTDSNLDGDVFLYDRVTGQMLLVSRVTGSAATAANGGSSQPVASPDGRYVTFLSTATNLVPGQIEGARPSYLDQNDAFLFDRVTGTVELISRAAGTATTTPDGATEEVALSADGRYAAFLSRGTNLVPGQIDSNVSGSSPTSDVFVHDRVTRITELVSHSAASTVRTGSSHSTDLALSPDGRFVAFLSSAGNLVPAVSFSQGLYLADRQRDTLERIAGAHALFQIAVGSDGEPIFAIAPPVLNAGGSAVFFTSDVPSLAAKDFNATFDVLAYTPAAPVTGSDFFTVPACRLLDTRLAADGPALLSDQPKGLAITGACGVPAGARAVSFNVTVTQATAPGMLTLHPGNLRAAGTSTINFAAGQTRANNAIIPLALNGEGSLGITPLVAGGGTVHVIVDVNGYFQ